MEFSQIAADGGLLPFAIKRDSSVPRPAKTHKFIVDITRCMDGSPTARRHKRRRAA